MHRSLKGKLVIGLVALSAAALAGGAYAATQSSGPSTRQAFLNDVAKRLHVTPQQLSSALKGAFDDQLQAAVKSGRLTQAQANRLQQRLQQKGKAAPLPFGLFGPHFGHPGLRGGGGGVGGPVGGPGRLSAAASYLGLSPAQLLQQLSAGKSLAQIAGAKGKSVSGLERAMTAAVKSRLDKAVAAKLITSAQERKLLARMAAHIAREVDQKGLPRPRQSLPPGFRGRGATPPNGPAIVPPAGAPLPYAPVA